jgi:hypothetical protein
MVEMTRETREGRPLLMGTHRVQMKGILPHGWFVGLLVPVQEIYHSVLAALVGSIQNVFFLTIHYFNSLPPSPSKLGRQPSWDTCLLVCVSGEY